MSLVSHIATPRESGSLAKCQTQDERAWERVRRVAPRLTAGVGAPGLPEAPRLVLPYADAGALPPFLVPRELFDPR